MKVNSAISDLWFSVDHSGCVVEDDSDNVFRYDDEALALDAGLFLDLLAKLGVNVPSVDELLQDFRQRM